MAHFYGSLQGSRGETTRLGTKNSGMEVVAASWEGSVRVGLRHTSLGDIVCIELRPWHGRGINRLLFEGLVSGHEENKLEEFKQRVYNMMEDELE